MSKKIWVVLWVCLVLNQAIFAASWLERYQKGDIVLKGDPSFGKNTDWNSLFYDSLKQMAVAPDGSVFVSNIRQCNLYKLDKNGVLLKTFSQSGMGPGDTIGPSDLSILDGQYLVVNECSEANRRISIFNLECKFIDCVRINSFVMAATALKENKIAYLVERQLSNELIQYTVKIVDFRTKQTISVCEFSKKIRKSTFTEDSFEEKVIIERINGGDLLVGETDSPEITIYACDGQKKYSFPLNIKPIKVTTAMKLEVKKMFEKHAQSQPILRHYMKKMDLDAMFPEYVPLYKRIMVDSDSNILVVKHTGFYLKGTMDFQVYQKNGQYVCDSRIQFGDYLSYALFPISFQKSALYCLLEKEEEEDNLIRIVKVNV